MGDRFSYKGVVITGASGLLGNELVKFYTEYKVPVLGIDKELPTKPIDGVRYLVKDVTEMTEDDYAQLVEVFDQYDVLINAIGMSHLDWLTDYKLDDLKEIYSVNTIAPIMFAKYFIKAHLTDHKLTTICNIISTGSLMSMRTSIGYCSTKAALSMATRQMGRELSGRYPNIRVFGINPCSFYDGTDNVGGIIEDILPEMLRTRPEQFHNLEEAKKYNLQSPTGSWLHVKDLVEFITFMVGYSNVHMNGSVLSYQDGGA